jgi:hypothetical protein
MLIKAADDKQPQLDALEALRTRPDVDAETKAQIDREIKNIRAGARASVTPPTRSTSTTPRGRATSSSTTCGSRSMGASRRSTTSSSTAC